MCKTQAPLSFMMRQVSHILYMWGFFSQRSSPTNMPTSSPLDSVDSHPPRIRVTPN